MIFNFVYIILMLRQLLSLITFNKSSDVSFHSGKSKNILDDYLVGKNTNEKMSPFQIYQYTGKTGFQKLSSLINKVQICSRHSMKRHEMRIRAHNKSCFFFLIKKIPQYSSQVCI